MKKIFTLIAGLLLIGGSAFAQEKWTNVIVNGDMEGAADPLWSSFWCHDWRRGVEFDPESGQQYDKDDPENGQFQGFAEIVEDPANPANHCAKVYVRSAAEAFEAGNGVTTDGNELAEDGSNFAGWDTQFFIYAKVDEPIPSGKMLRVSFKYKADKGGTKAGTQAHEKPGNYNHWALIGDVNFTTEWQTFNWEGTLDSNQAPDDKGFYSIAFNLADYKDGYTAYFDDVKMEIKDQGEPEPFAGWFNLLRKGTNTADKIGNFTTFTGRDGTTGQDVQARIVNDPLDGQPALNVSAIAWNATKEEVKKNYELDEETGDTLRDEQGNPIFEEEIEEVNIHIKENGDTLTNIDDWQTQFFVTVPHKWVSGQKYKLAFWARADHDASVDTQAHTTPGSYVYWNFCGTLDLTEDWQYFEFGGDEEDPATISSDANGCQTIAFNCNKVKDEPVNYYFRFEEFSFNTADVTTNERILGSENITLPVDAASNKEGITVDVDLTDLVATLELEELEKYLDETILKVKTVDEDGDEIYTEESLQPAAGFSIDKDGNYTEAENSLSLLIGETVNGNKVSFNMLNEGVDLENGIFTKFLFITKEGWYYLINASFTSKEKYEEMLGISEMAVAKKNANAIYDLMGRKVQKAGKGLYIKDGKKVLF